MKWKAGSEVLVDAEEACAAVGESEVAEAKNYAARSPLIESCSCLLLPRWCPTSAE